MHQNDANVAMDGIIELDDCGKVLPLSRGDEVWGS